MKKSGGYSLAGNCAAIEAAGVNGRDTARGAAFFEDRHLDIMGLRDLQRSACAFQERGGKIQSRLCYHSSLTIYNSCTIRVYDLRWAARGCQPTKRFRAERDHAALIAPTIQNLVVAAPVATVPGHRVTQ